MLGLNQFQKQRTLGCHSSGLLPACCVNNKKKGVFVVNAEFPTTRWLYFPEEVSRETKATSPGGKSERRLDLETDVSPHQ